MAGTIAAIATPVARGGISVIRISGTDAIAVADRVFTAASGGALAGKKGYTASYGTVSHGGEVLDESVALVFRGPKSYTGEDVVELSCHGGLMVTRELLRAVLDSGAALAGPGEFTKRAFLNGKLNLTQAEAVADLIQANNYQAIKASHAQLDGALARKIQKVLERLIEQAGHLSAWVDYPEEEIPLVEEDKLKAILMENREILTQLLATFDTGRMIREGIDTVIVGKPNVGKSTLMNLLAGCRRSIVTEIAGTTRDIVEDTITLGEVVLRLADTAGLRVTEDPVEKEGVLIAEERLKHAALLLAVFDGSQPLNQEDEYLIQRLQGKQVVAVINKTDLEKRIETERVEKFFSEVLLLSAKDENSLELLKAAIKRKVGLKELNPGAAILATERQRVCAVHAEDALREAIDALEAGMTLDAVTVSVEGAIDALLELSGKRVTEEVVNSVFSHFCVGK